MTAQELILALARATLSTCLAAGLASCLLAKFQIASPRMHRVAWLLVIAQGWLLIPWTLEIETSPAPPNSTMATIDVMDSSQPLQVAAPLHVATHERQTQFDVLGTLATAIVSMWMIGVVAASIPFAWRYARFACRVFRERAVTNSTWQEEWENRLRVANVRRDIDLQATHELGPLLCWVPFRYLVLVPQVLWELLTRAERETILRHELAHFLRGDLWKSLFIRILALPQWFNPLAWRAVRAFDEAGEWACDDLVAGATHGDELVLARSLVRAGEFATHAMPGTVAAHGGVLSRRIRRLVAPDFKEESKMKKFLVMSVLVALVAVQLVRLERVAAEEACAAVVPAKGESPETKAFDSRAYLAKWKRSSLGPYSIEPPDILRIKITNIPHIQLQSSRSEVQPFEDTYALGPDGRVELGDWGSVYVAGLTTDEAANRIEQKLQSYDKFSDAEVSVDLAMPNSKVVYFVLEQDGADEVVRMPYEPGSTLSSFLQETPVPNPIDFASAKIEVRRSRPNDVGIQTVLDVDWNAKEHGPTADTDHPLRPRDQIFVTVPTAPQTPDENASGRAAHAESSVAPPIIDARHVRLDVTTGAVFARGVKSISPSPTHHPQAARVVFEIEFVNDEKGSLAEFESLRDCKVLMTAESDTILPVLRILTKHRLIKKLSSPRIICEVGQAASLECGHAPSNNDEEWQGFRMEATAKKLENALSIRLKMESAQSANKQDAALTTVVKEEETLVIRADWWQAAAAVKAKNNSGKSRLSDIYVVITPRLIK